MNNAANGMPWARRTQAGACRGAGSELVPAAGHGILTASLIFPVNRLEYATYSSADMFGLLECQETVGCPPQAE